MMYSCQLSLYMTSNASFWSVLEFMALPPPNYFSLFDIYAEINYHILGAIIFRMNLTFSVRNAFQLNYIQLN